MPWEIHAGPEQVQAPAPGTVSWTWQLVDEDGEGERVVEVVVSELAGDTEHTQLARRSNGRRLVEGVLSWAEPPRRIRCTLIGFVCEGGVK